MAASNKLVACLVRSFLLKATPKDAMSLRNRPIWLERLHKGKGSKTDQVEESLIFIARYTFGIATSLAKFIEKDGSVYLANGKAFLDLHHFMKCPKDGEKNESSITKTGGGAASPRTLVQEA